MSNSHRAARAPKPAPGTTRRIVGNTLFVGGLVLCGGALVQPANDAPSVLLTNGTTTGGSSSDTTSGGSSGTTSSGGSSGTTSSGGSSGTTCSGGS